MKLIVTSSNLKYQIRKDKDQRKDILKLIMTGEPLEDNVDLNAIASCADGFSGSDLKELCRNAAMYRIRDYMKSNQNALTPPNDPKEDVEAREEFQETLRPITQLDLKKSLDKIKETKLRTSSLGD